MAQPLLCALDDVKARATVTTGDTALADLIESVSDEMETYVGAWLAPRPTLGTDPAVALLFDVENPSRTLRLRQGNTVTGVRTLSALGVATTSQPEAGGTYTTVPLTSALLRPRPTEDGPAMNLVLVAPYAFVRGFNTVSASGYWGPAAVAPRVREVAIELVMFDLANGGKGATSESIGDWSVSYGKEARDEILCGLDSLALVAV